MAFAESMGVSPRTVRDWMARDDVRRVWKKRADEIVGDPQKVADVIEEMRQLALDRTQGKQVQAAKLYLDAVDAITPKEREAGASDPGAIEQLTDEQLDARIAEAMAMMRAKEVLSD